MSQSSPRRRSHLEPHATVWGFYASLALARQAQAFQQDGPALWRVAFLPVRRPGYPFSLWQYPRTLAEEAGPQMIVKLPIGPTRDLLAKLAEFTRNNGRGISAAEAQARTGVPYPAMRARLQVFEDLGFAAGHPQGGDRRYRITEQGMALLEGREF